MGIQPPATPPLDVVEARMRPGELSQAGFLAPGERLAEVLAADRETLTALGVSAGDLADRLEAALEAAMASRSRSARVGDLDVRVTAFTGFQICPWAPNPDQGQCPVGGGTRYGSVDWQIRNRVTGEALEGPGLLVHLARGHGFFEGPRTPFRVDPARLARVLGLVR